jgi:hypothetical protein
MVSDLNYVNENKVTSYAVSGFAKFKVDNFTAKLEGLYGANLSDLTMLVFCHQQMFTIDFSCY